MKNNATEEVKRAQKEVDENCFLMQKVLGEVNKIVVGQKNMIEKIFIALLSNGHILIEGVPGLAKTLAVKTVALALHCDFKRIQFTPDLLPSDLIGTEIFDIKNTRFSLKKGPIFTNIVLADEINRAPAKVQSALLEAMQEKQITIGENSFVLEEPFFVLATQNPIEHEGTYPLPEAQLDRFMLKINVEYPTKEEEKIIVNNMSKKETPVIQPLLHKNDILKLQNLCETIFMDESLLDYVLNIVEATRYPEKFSLDNLKKFIEYGASPRASIYLTKTAKTRAFLEGRGYVLPEDVKAMCMDILRHRIILTYEAEAEEIRTEDIIQNILDAIKVP